ncbi:hypothetical protein BBK36DRAFT_1128735 [Trichoderma citrinoviride]|uniref:Uncharacterized protein n=1 Tax=Trichoderma citrinoviride TaxID=58853 RepID=A0A2T4AZS2_9HYPO|nr:hypothetical protein BBK36DRAFT_1128735 [Trichoderma citrinoviride]PTB62563.1 hypothetical protein BBK36DRAFT_1128735 [Trichoderma citrinoviride]
MGCAESKEAHQRLRSASLSGVTVPNSLELSYDPSWSKLRLHLLNSSSEPVYTVNLPGGWWGSLILYDGPTVEHPPLAAVRNTGKSGMGNLVTLPPLWPGEEVFEEKISRRNKGWMDAWSFAVPVLDRAGEKATTRVERFEWVSSGGKEVKGLHEWGRGWKLRRVAGSQAAAYADKAWEDEKDEGDAAAYEYEKLQADKEVLAVWADANGFSKRAAKFEFVNSGATGELGEAWRVMAVVSFVRVWQRYMQIAVA